MCKRLDAIRKVSEAKLLVPLITHGKKNAKAATFNTFESRPGLFHIDKQEQLSKTCETHNKQHLRKKRCRCLGKKVDTRAALSSRPDPAASCQSSFCAQQMTKVARAPANKARASPISSALRKPCRRTTSSSSRSLYTTGSPTAESPAVVTPARVARIVQREYSAEVSTRESDTANSPVGGVRYFGFDVRGRQLI